MKILLCHNYYQQAGGEDQVFADEGWLLEENGHEVVKYTRHNDDIADLSSLQRMRKTFWNPRTIRDLEPILEREKPQIMHCTNTFPLISPAAFSVARRHGVKIVQSIHNYRLICPTATFLRNGKVCEDCVGHTVAIPAIRHRCYRGDLGATTVVALYQAYHRLRKTWHDDVDRFIALTDFSRDKLTSVLPPEKISVKPNFVHPDPGIGTGKGDYLLFVGRLSEEKGVQTLVDCWRAHTDLPKLTVIGDGPLASIVQQASDELPHLHWEGRQPLARVYAALHDATGLIVPSVWYEVCPKTILEAFAKGIPVLGSRLGGMVELIDENVNGLLFEPGDIGSLATVARRIENDSGLVDRLRQGARQSYMSRYTPEINYAQLLGIYEQVLARPAKHAVSHAPLG